MICLGFFIHSAPLKEGQETYWNTPISLKCLWQQSSGNICFAVKKEKKSKAIINVSLGPVIIYCFFFRENKYLYSNIVFSVTTLILYGTENINNHHQKNIFSLNIIYPLELCSQPMQSFYSISGQTAFISSWREI